MNASGQKVFAVKSKKKNKSFYKQIFLHDSTGVNFKEANGENKQELFGDIYTAIDTLAFTFGNV